MTNNERRLLIEASRFIEAIYAEAENHERVRKFARLRGAVEREAAKATQTKVAAVFGFAVYPGSERIDLGPKRVVCLCESEAQAKHMAAFWGPYGYYEPIAQPEGTAEAGEE